MSGAALMIWLSVISIFQESVLRPHVEDPLCVNNLGNEGSDSRACSYALNYDRLVEIKTKYDSSEFPSKLKYRSPEYRRVDPRSENARH